MIIYCLHCKTTTTNNKFCSKSCSASYNNKGKRRHGNQKIQSNCLTCNKNTYNDKYCSNFCSANARKKPIEEIRANNAERQSRYRQKKYREIHPTADKNLIKEFYKNRPNGFEVDHIIPLSKGGLHHQDNLQYLPKDINRKKSNKMVVDAGIEPARPLGVRL